MRRISVRRRLVFILVLFGVGIYFLSSRYLFFGDRVIYSSLSQNQKIILTKDSSGGINLFLDDRIKFNSFTEARYYEPLVHVPMSLGIKNNKILVMGGGDGLIVRELLKYTRASQIDVVDSDNILFKLASTNKELLLLNKNSLSDPRVIINSQNIFEFLNKSTQLYDVIIIDLPEPFDNEKAKFYTREFYQLIRVHLNKTGIFVTQAPSAYAYPNTFRVVKNTIESENFYTYPYKDLNSDTYSYFILGSRNKIDSGKADIKVNVRMISTEAIPILFQTDPFVPLAENIETNSLNNLILVKLFNEDKPNLQPLKKIIQGTQ